MGFGSLGFAELAVIFIIVLVFFGPRRLPEIARSMGHAMREFRRSLNQIQRELEDADPRSSITGRSARRARRADRWSGATTPEKATDDVETPGTDATGAADEAAPVPDPDQIPMFGAAEGTDVATDSGEGSPEVPPREENRRE